MGLLSTTSKKVKFVVQIPYDSNALEIKQKLNDVLPNMFAQYAFILHDQDLNEDNTKKNFHFHVVAIFNGDRAKRLSTYLNMLSKTMEISKDCISILPSINLSKDIRYLTHEDNPEKHPYQTTEVITSDYSWYTENYNGLGIDNDITFAQLLQVMKSCKGNYLDIVSVLTLSVANKYNWVIKNLLTNYDFTENSITKKTDNEQFE